mgnify:CR=1 FL=1
MVSIHAPREGCDVSFPFRHLTPQKFQFTHPGRGATHLRTSGQRLFPCFNSRTPGGVRRCSALSNCYTKSVSIHAPREGCDFSGDAFRRRYDEFQFTHPGRGATPPPSTAPTSSSKFQFTHPGRGATEFHSKAHAQGQTFQFTHPGRGATIGEYTHLTDSLVFQFTHPGRGATVWFTCISRRCRVSIHAPREGCDRD